ncbi:hypothetical protein AYO40_02885 [Planctomycetaceae bacterium SCGC AG-212-D15]|nr:hypothetical protein AYO40_02885 [Planctomycetaceae bacterium SCGC AG-212-D15]
MPDPDRLLNTLRKAAGAFRDTPGRRGRLVTLQDVDDVFIAGDLHGNVANFRRLLERAQLAEHPRRHFVVQEVIHGGARYPEGGDKSHQMVDLVAALKCQYPTRTHWLLGNHELAQWSDRLILKADDDLNARFRQGVTEAYGARSDEIYAAYRELFTSLPAALRTPNRVFLSHSLPKASRLAGFDLPMIEAEGPLTPGDALYHMVWGRDTSPDNVAEFLARVNADLLITGHIPVPAGFSAPNGRQIILDCIGTPAGFCLFPTDRPLTHVELMDCVGTV